MGDGPCPMDDRLWGQRPMNHFRFSFSLLLPLACVLEQAGLSFTKLCSSGVRAEVSVLRRVECFPSTPTPRPGLAHPHLRPPSGCHLILWGHGYLKGFGTGLQDLGQKSQRGVQTSWSGSDPQLATFPAFSVTTGQDMPEAGPFLFSVVLESD